VAANSADTFEWAGRQGYPIFVASQVNPFRKIKELLPLYRQARKAAGRGEPQADDITLLGPLYVAEDPVQLRRELEPSIRRFLQSIATIYATAGPVPEGRIKEVLERVRQLTYEKVCEVMAIFETPDACVERLKRYQQEFGMGRMICWFNPGGMVAHEHVMRSMELFAKKVMPQF
jgi:alkanesulfonate monooxygenase SsuD/methylene tetrahydromethanopterin reductase-like flavin-dependent oxidoreductase (luciferase family)